jgi:alcohol dehydrogenase
MVVTDSFIARSGMMAPVLAALAAQGFAPVVFSGCVPDPTTASIAAGLAAWHEAGAAADGVAPDVIVGFGGGSSIDTAKAIAMLAVAGGSVADYKMPAAAPRGLTVVAIPTTAGARVMGSMHAH